MELTLNQKYYVNASLSALESEIDIGVKLLAQHGYENAACTLKKAACNFIERYKQTDKYPTAKVIAAEIGRLQTILKNFEKNFYAELISL